MRKSTIILIIILAFTVIFTSCESMISDVDVPESEPKLVVNGFLSANDDTITIKVSKSKPLYEETDLSVPYEVVNNATVTIANGPNSVILPFNPISNAYQIQTTAMPLTGGETYSLAVTTPDGFNVTSSCTIPSGMAPEAEITGIDSSNQYGEDNKKISLRFRDLPGPGHYYRIDVGTFFKYEFDPNYYFNEIGFERGDQFVSDKNKEEDYFLYRTNELYNYGNSSNTLIVSLFITDENYYNYHRSLNTNNDGDNPFAEPTPVFSNIKGGLGVFAGINGHVTAFPVNSH